MVVKNNPIEMSFAKIEFEILKKSNTDPDNRPLIEEFESEILALVKKFNESGQSGGSAPYVASSISEAVKNLCLQQPICPITGIDKEWTNVSDYNDDKEWYQNKRCSGLFKDGKDSNPYYIDAIIFQGEDEYNNFSRSFIKNFIGKVENITSTQFIKKFPFIPKTFYIDVYQEKYDKNKHSNLSYHENDGNKYVYLIKDKNQLEDVYKYYSKDDNWKVKVRKDKLKNF